MTKYPFTVGSRNESRILQRGGGGVQLGAAGVAAHLLPAFCAPSPYWARQTWPRSNNQGLKSKRRDFYLLLWLTGMPPSISSSPACHWWCLCCPTGEGKLLPYSSQVMRGPYSTGIAAGVEVVGGHFPCSCPSSWVVGNTQREQVGMGKCIQPLHSPQNSTDTGSGRRGKAEWKAMHLWA